MNHQIKMVGLDLDGTLLNSNKEITDYTKKVIAEAIDNGCIVLAATGRPLSAVPQYLLDVVGTQYVLTTNGAVIVDMKTGENIYEHLLPVELTAQALDIFAEYDVLTEVFIDDVGYTDAKTLANVEKYVGSSPSMIAYMKESRIPVESVKEKLYELKKPVGKAHAIFADPSLREKVKEHIQSVMDVDLTSSSPRDLDVNKKGANKGLGLLRLGEILGIKREEIMACGDSFNDLEMLVEAGIGVAMGNAEEDLKTVADYITDTNDNDGVAKAIEKFVLNR